MAYCGPRGIELAAFLRWSPASQRAALEWQAYENRRCSACGSHPEDWAEDPRAHHAHMRQCKGCQAKQRVAESDRAKDAERGTQIVLAPGSGAHCATCRPVDID